MLDLSHIESRLQAHKPREVSLLVAPRRAAVAALLRFERGEAPEVLLMKRVSRKTDRWSGHVSFPGGMSDPDDSGLVATAVRETREEVGINLKSTARLIGQLDDQRAIAKGHFLPMAITPFVFFQTEPSEVVLGDEAEDSLWLPLDAVLAGELDDTYNYRLGPVPMKLPCWRFDGHVVWGLTHRMLTRMLEILRG